MQNIGNTDSINSYSDDEEGIMDDVVLLGNVWGCNLFCPIFSHADFVKTTKRLANNALLDCKRCPLSPLSNALLNPYKAPFKNRIYNYLITKNLRRSLIKSFFTHFPTFPLHFCQYISRGAGCWVVGVNGFYKVHCKSTHHQHLTPNIILMRIFRIRYSLRMIKCSFKAHIV